jgi:glucan-binding YG repeat protein
MNKMGKRFVALVVVFVSIMSFLPIRFGLNGQAANALNSTATDIEVGGSETVNSSKKPIYSTENQATYFTVTVKDLRTQPDEKIQTINQPTVTDQEVILTSINRIKLDNQATYSDNIKTLSDMGITIGTTTDNGRIGAKIEGLPLGINEITYKVKVTEKTRQYIDILDPTKGTKLIENITQNDDKKINIEHANSYVQSQIPYIDFMDYVGGRPPNPDTTFDDNKTPFQYTERIAAQSGKSLRFEHDLPNSVTDMDYKINFPNKVNTQNGDIVYVNGSQATDVSTSTDEKTLTGSLKKTATSTILIISIKHDKAIENTYAVEIQYNNKLAENDYVLKDAGITKLNYNSDSTVKAYIGKQFETTFENGVLTYKGTITVDRKAQMISLEPNIGRSSANTAFKISNYYDSQVINSKLINGKQYVDFAKGTNNEIWLEVYAGKDGNATGSVPLAIYKLKVNVTGSSDSTVNFLFPDSILTQPGRTTADGLDFDPDRRTYDLYLKQADSNNVSVSLDKPVTYENEDNTKRREYIKAWGGTSVQSDNVTEISGLGKVASVNIDITNYKKIILQAYYDQVVYKKDADGNITSDEESRTPYPIGQKYTFYIAKNAGTPDNGGETTSSNASLSNIIADNGNIKSTDGTSGFSSDKFNYNVTVPKIDTSSAITVTAENSKVKDITATLIETGDQYGLTSGQPFDFPLNSNGKTNIKIVVTAQDGISSKIYNVTINNDTRSASALLKNVITDKGDFTFDSEADPNKIRVDQAITKLKVSPVPEDSKSKVTVNGEKFSGTPITINLTGSQETDMEIVVTSEDGSDSKTYSFEIYRTDTPLDNNDNTNESDVFYDEIDDCWVDTSKYEEWGTVKGKDVYFNNKGRQVKEQWINTKNTWYYLNSNGYKTTGWRKDIGGKSYYLDTTTGQLKTGWMNQNNKWYYLGLNGVMHKGWLYLNGKWYYFTPEGEMVTNQSMFVDDKVYNFAQDGSIY